MAALSIGLWLLGHASLVGAADHQDRTSATALPPRAARFHAAVLSFREQASLLAAVPPTSDARGLRRAVAALAHALESVPETRGVDVTEAAEAVRRHFPESTPAMTGPTDPIRTAYQVRSALLTAAGAMVLLARGPYRNAAEMSSQVADFERASRKVDPAQGIYSERQLVLAALVRAADVLTAIERASGIAPTMVPSASDAGT